MSFLYFLPDIARTAPLPSQEVIASRGLAYAFESRPFGCGCSGPQGKEGFVLGCRRRWESGQVKIEPTQIWTPHPSGKYFVGYWPDQLPTPDQLAREKLLSGHLLKLADEREWQIPLARGRHDESTAETPRVPYSVELPQRSQLNEQGEWIDGGVLPKYRALWELASGWNDFRRAQLDDPDHERLVEHWSRYQTRHEAAVQVLAANYVVGPVECSLLGILNKELAAEILDLAIDEPEFDRILKKWLAAYRLNPAQTSAAAGSTSSPGPVAETITIDPPSPTSPP